MMQESTCTVNERRCVLCSRTHALLWKRQRKVSVVAVRGKTLEALGEEKRSNRLMKYNRRCLCFFWILKRNRLHERWRTYAPPTNRFRNSDRSNDTVERYKEGQIRIEKFRSSRDNWSGDFTEIPFLSLERHFHRGGQHSSRETAILADVIAGRR